MQYDFTYYETMFDWLNEVLVSCETRSSVSLPDRMWKLASVFCMWVMSIMRMLCCCAVLRNDLKFLIPEEMGQCDAMGAIGNTDFRQGVYKTFEKNKERAHSGGRLIASNNL